MTQNLDYSLPTGDNKTISKDGTDLTADQTGLTITGYNNTTGVGEWGTNDNAIKFYNPGLWVYSRYDETHECSFINNISKCAGYGWKEYAPGDNEHYLIGNYYSWPASTAGTEVDPTTNTAKGSICPAHWKLPLSGGVYNNTSGSFFFLLNKYGLTSVISNDNYNVALAPLYFLRGSYVYAAYMGAPGVGAGYWSSTVSSDGAFDLYFDRTYVNPSSFISRSYGLSIRCVVM